MRNATLHPDIPLTLILTVVLTLAAPGLTAADILEVPTEFPTIQQAVNMAVAGDEIVILPGTYVENVSLDGKASLIIRSTGDATATIVDGGLAGPVFYLEGCHRVAIRQLTIRHGRLGVQVIGSDPVQIAESIIEDNNSLDDGGGFYVLNSNVLIENNAIRNNNSNFPAGLDGGGIFFHASSGVISGNVVEGNRAHEGAGIIVNVSTTPSLVVRDNLIVNNEAMLHGGGFFTNFGTRPEFRSNTVVGNRAGGFAGGVGIREDSSPVMERNIVAANLAADGGGVFVFGPAAPSFACNDVWDNSGGNYRGKVIDPTGRDGNISVDPLFCDPLRGDYSLAQNSPCAPGHSPPGCDLIGALPVGCGPVAVEATTWGSLKSLYSAGSQ